MANQLKPVDKSKALLNTLVKGVMIIYILLLLITLFVSINASPGMHILPTDTGYGGLHQENPVFVVKLTDELR
jgi:hypothetical protein